MKGLKEWAAEVANNKNFLKEFNHLKDNKKIVDLAKEEGYEFTEDELTNLKMKLISGGNKKNNDFFKVLHKNKKIVNSIVGGCHYK